MEPTSIDLSSVAGIMAATILLVHFLKGRIVGVPYLEAIPIAAYVIVVALGLTFVAHDVLHVLEGDRGDLLQQAFLQAMAASGVVEWWRAGAKPLAASERALDASLRRAVRRHRSVEDAGARAKIRRRPGRWPRFSRRRNSSRLPRRPQRQ